MIHRPSSRLLAPLAAALLTLVATASHAAPHRTKDDQRASLVSLLSAYELDLKRPVLDTIGPDVPTLLIAIANHPRELPRVRVRALAALALYPNEATLAYLRAQLWERSWMGGGLGTQMRRQALRSLGRGFGLRALDDVSALKDDPEPLVREAVAWALGDIGSPRAVPVLETWLAQEKAFTVRDAVDRALTQLRGM